MVEKRKPEGRGLLVEEVEEGERRAKKSEGRGAVMNDCGSRIPDSEANAGGYP